MKDRVISIAIDGPAGAGKSTTARSVADQLGILHLDTGALYRATALACLENNLEKGNTQAIVDLLSDIEIDIDFDEGAQLTLLNGENVNSKIRTAEVSVWASDVSAVPEVREKLLDLQRDLAKRMSLVIDGRDIGSFVLPDADVKIFLIANPNVRATRRLKELQEKGSVVTFEEVYQDMIYRDKQDSTRAIAPLVKADDALEIDTSDQTIPETAKIIIDYMHELID